MQEIENENIGGELFEGKDPPHADQSRKRISEADVREMFGENRENIRRRKKRNRRRSMPEGEIRDPLEKMTQEFDEVRKRKEKQIDVPGFVLAESKKKPEKEPEKEPAGRLFSRWRRKKKKVEPVRQAAAPTPADAEDMIDIDEIKEKIKNDDGKMSTSGFLIAMGVLFAAVFLIVLVTFTASRMSRAIKGNVDSSDYDSSVEVPAQSVPDPESVAKAEVSVYDRLGNPAVQSALAYMADPADVGDVSTRDLSQYLPEMPKEGQEIVRTESGVLYTYERMVRDLYFLSVRFSNLFMVNTIGSTKDGRAIYDAVIGNPNAERHFIVAYSQHGSEHINTQLAMRQIEYILTTMMNGGSYADKTYGDIFSNVCFHMLPMANPDGVTVSQLGVDGLRTDAAKTVVNLCYELDKAEGKVYGTFEEYQTKFKANANGVDLNKNFNVGWEALENNVNAPSMDGYKGSAAVSEAETQAIVALANAYPIAAVIGVHSPGDRIVWNYGAEGDVLTAETNLAETLKALTNYPMAAESHYTNRVAGGMAEYFVSERNVPAVSIMTGAGTLPVDMSYFARIFGVNLNVIPAIAYLYVMPSNDEIAAEEAAAAAEAAAAEAAEQAEADEWQNEEDYDEQDYEDREGDYYYDDDGNRVYY